MVLDIAPLNDAQ